MLELDGELNDIGEVRKDIECSRRQFYEIQRNLTVKEDSSTRFLVPGTLTQKGISRKP